MDSDERDIFNFLKTWGATFVGAKEICRRAATRQRFYDEPDWAKVVLLRMTESRLLETDGAARYRIKRKPKEGRNHQWVSPELAKILNDGGVSVEGAADLDADDPDEQP